VEQIAIASSALAHIRRTAAQSPDHEVCGLLLGDGVHIGTASDAANVASDPSCRFEIDPAALFAAMRAERAGGPTIMGWWHSHPRGSADPSRTDAAMADPDGRLWIIVGDERVSAWRAQPGGTVHDRFDPVELVCRSDGAALAT
jgi:proteasome lid subunit RPN8/RPN11